MQVSNHDNVSPTAHTQRRSLLKALMSALVLGMVSPALLAKQHWLAQPALADLQVLDQAGNTWRLLEDLINGRTVVINFMFTGCASVCPPQTALMRALRKQLDDADREVLLLSITVDPLHDQPPQLRSFAQRYGITLGEAHGWLMLTGAQPQMTRISDALGASTAVANAHPALLWVGNAPRQRWTRSSSLNPPHMVMQLIKEVQS